VESIWLLLFSLVNPNCCHSNELSLASNGSGSSVLHHRPPSSGEPSAGLPSSLWPRSHLSPSVMVFVLMASSKLKSWKVTKEGSESGFTICPSVGGASHSSFAPGARQQTRVSKQGVWNLSSFRFQVLPISLWIHSESGHDMTWFNRMATMHKNDTEKLMSGNIK